MKNTKVNDEINLFDLIIILIKRKLLLLIFSIAGLVVGLAHTLTQEPRYQTEFTVYINHTLIPENFIMTPDVRELITKSQMFGTYGITPHLSFNKANRVFTITSNTKEIQNNIETLFRDSIEASMDDLIATSTIFKSNLTNLTDDGAKIQSPNMLLLLVGKEKLVQLKHEVSKRLKINIGPVVAQHPNKKKYGLIGLGIGFFAGILMVIVSILFDSIKSRQNTNNN